MWPGAIMLMSGCRGAACRASTVKEQIVGRRRRAKSAVAGASAAAKKCGDKRFPRPVLIAGEALFAPLGAKFGAPSAHIIIKKQQMPPARSASMSAE